MLNQKKILIKMITELDKQIDKYEFLLKVLRDLNKAGWTGWVKLSFIKGNLSVKIEKNSFEFLE